MTNGLNVDKELYPNLFREHNWGRIISNFEVFNNVPERLISNINIVPFINRKCILIQLDNGNWEIPGGTLEANESYQSALDRELVEEAGARLVSSFTIFGAWKFISSAEKPYRPHLPHPIYYRVVGYGDVELASVPLIPEGGENVVAVEAMTIQEAKQNFIHTGRPDLAELYEIADLLRTK
ncbi:NUDIX domain-containing protein [Paenibacillus sp. RC67]|uniref:NUDIX hydrolase n=1 Tax=Paenibacillus sp. RC67 TaxID=3039392 RepID=UPI0024AD109A|nr:NUDIX domain-containing protein [Paenibacillus sp. RC67]